MICRHCQLVEMERVRREGETNLYRCPKCGATQRMTAQQTAAARARTQMQKARTKDAEPAAPTRRKQKIVEMKMLPRGRKHG